MFFQLYIFFGAPGHYRRGHGQRTPPQRWRPHEVRNKKQNFCLNALWTFLFFTFVSVRSAAGLSEMPSSLFLQLVAGKLKNVPSNFYVLKVY